MRNDLLLGEKTVIDVFLDYWKKQSRLPTSNAIETLMCDMRRVEDAPGRSHIAVKEMVFRRLMKLRAVNKIVPQLHPSHAEQIRSAIKGALAELEALTSSLCQENERLFEENQLLTERIQKMELSAEDVNKRLSLYKDIDATVKFLQKMEGGKSIKRLAKKATGADA